MESEHMTNTVDFEVTITKDRRINIPKTLYQLQAGDIIRVRVIKTR